MTTVHPYPAGTKWKYRNKMSGHEFVGELTLYWEPSGSTMSDDYTPDEIGARELWRLWVDQYGMRAHNAQPDRYAPGDVEINWSVSSREAGTFEAAPHQAPSPYLDEDFLTFFAHPTHAATGERLNWLRLPTVERGWNEHTCSKSGFVQEATGWKPSPFQSVMNVFQLGTAAGLYVPDRV